MGNYGSYYSNGPFVTTSVADGLMAMDLVDTMLAEGIDVVISNVVYSGQPEQAGIFEATMNVIGMRNGTILSSGRVSSIEGSNSAGTASQDCGGGSDSDLANISAVSVFDAAVLTFDFECPGEDRISFLFAFGSEEYPEYAGSNFNDAFGFFVNGENVALLPGTTTEVSINNVNHFTNNIFYVDNTGGMNSFEADGHTVTLAVEAMIEPGVNSMKFAIGDGGDSILNSWVFVKGKSFRCGEALNTTSTTTTSTMTTTTTTLPPVYQDQIGQCDGTAFCTIMTYQDCVEGLYALGYDELPHLSGMLPLEVNNQTNSKKVAGCSSRNKALGTFVFNDVFSSTAVHKSAKDKRVICKKCPGAAEFMLQDFACDGESYCVIQDQATCEAAGAELGFPDTKPAVGSWTNKNAGCSTNNGGGLRFNTNFGSTYMHPNTNRQAVCQICDGRDKYVGATISPCTAGSPC